MKGGDKPILLGAQLDGAKTMVLTVEDAGDNIDFDQADWADAKIYVAGGTDKAQYPQSMQRVPQEPMQIAHADNTRLSDQLSPHHRLDSRPSVPLPDPGDREARR